MSPPRPSPMALALVWVSRITTVALEMVLPGLAGHWLDNHLGTQFLVFVGFAFGLTAGIWHLTAMTRPPSRPPRPGQDDSSS